MIERKDLSISRVSLPRPLVCATCCVALWLALMVIPWHGIRAQVVPQPNGTLIIFAAASLTEAFTEIGTRLESRYPGLRVLYNFAGSQLLRTQLQQGAPADVLASADPAQMALVQESGLIQGEGLIFAKNRLVMIVPRDNPGDVRTFGDLAKPDLQLVLAAPQVPAGRYSRQVIQRASEAFGDDFAPRVLDNVVSEENNVKQVVLKLQLGEADAGISYVSDVTSEVRQNVFTIAIPDEYNQTATYPIAVLNEAPNRIAAEAFLAFVLSASGQTVLQAHNFIPVTE